MDHLSKMGVASDLLPSFAPLHPGGSMTALAQRPETGLLSATDPNRCKSDLAPETA